MGLRHAFVPWPMRPPPATREAFAAAIALIAARITIDLRLRASDERRQSIDAAGVGDHWLRLRLGLRLILRLWTMFARLLLIAVIGLRIAVAHVGLRL